MIWFVPKGLSTGVVNAQMIQPILNDSSERHVLAVPSCDAHRYAKSSKLDIRTYESLREFRSILKIQSSYYTRSIFDFFKVYFWTIRTKGTIHYSYRGLVYAESFYRNRSHARKFLLYLMELSIAHMADELSCVSREMKLALRRIFGVKKNINVRPCGISQVHTGKTKFNANLHFVYVGGMASWQKIEETVSLYDKIRNGLNQPSKLSIVTNDVTLAKEKISALTIKPDDIEFCSLSPEEVSRFLQRCDFGFLLREQNIVNQVASPIKFLEYTSNGVVPIVSPWIGDYSKDVEREQLGICLKSPFHDDQILTKIEKCLENETIFHRLSKYSQKYLHSNYRA